MWWRDPMAAVLESDKVSMVETTAASRASATTASPQAWSEIYASLHQDRNNGVAFAALAARVRSWARRSLRDYGWGVVEDTVADTCASALLKLDRANGPDTFSGFVH